MVIYELLGHTTRDRSKGDAKVARVADNFIEEAKRAVPRRPTRRSKAPAKGDPLVGSAVPGRRRMDRHEGFDGRISHSMCTEEHRKPWTLIASWMRPRPCAAGLASPSRSATTS